MRRDVGRQFDPAVFRAFEEIDRRVDPDAEPQHRTHRRCTTPPTERSVATHPREDGLTGVLPRAAFVAAVAEALAQRRTPAHAGVARAHRRRRARAGERSVRPAAGRRRAVGGRPRAPARAARRRRHRPIRRRRVRDSAARCAARRRARGRATTAGCGRSSSLPAAQRSRDDDGRHGLGRRGIGAGACGFRRVAHCCRGSCAVRGAPERRWRDGVGRRGRTSVPRRRGWISIGSSVASRSFESSSGGSMPRVAATVAS